jgi:ribonuclease Z
MAALAAAATAAALRGAGRGARRHAGPSLARRPRSSVASGGAAGAGAGAGAEGASEAALLDAGVTRTAQFQTDSMELTFLGTSSSAATRERNQTGLLLRTARETLLFDAGDGVMTQMRRCQNDYVGQRAHLRHVFVSHMHGDHLFGLPALATALLHGAPEQRLSVCGPLGVREFLRHALHAATESFYESVLSFRELKAMSGNETLVVRDGKDKDGPRARAVPVAQPAGLTVSAVRVRHTVPCWGFVVEEHARPRIVPELLQDLKIDAGPHCRRLLAGEAVQLADGRVVQPESVVEHRPGRKVAVIFDTSDASNALEAVRGADVLVHEATYLEEERGKSQAFGHSTARMAAQFAAAAGVKRLVLTHFSPRYSLMGREEMGALFLEEAGAFFPANRIVLARDLLVVDVPPRYVTRRMQQGEAAREQQQ